MVTFCLVSNDSELEAILRLQQENLGRFLSEEEAAREGFVTAEYSLEFLRSMNEETPAVIAKAGDDVVGYSLVASRAIVGKHQLLDDLFISADQSFFNGESLKESNYVLCGQLCVAKGYRGQGIAQAMYGLFKSSYREKFKYCITDVASANPRSLRAHIKSGFQVINSFEYGGICWNLVLWAWNEVSCG